MGRFYQYRLLKLTVHVIGYLLENYRLVAIEKNSLLDVQLDRPRQGLGLGIPADRHQRIWTVGVVHMLHRLRYDRALIQIRSHIVRRGTDQLNPPSVSLMVGLRTLKTRQE